MSLGLMSRKQAIKALHPEFNDTQIDAWLKEVEDDEEFLEGISSGAGGQFTSNNQAAAPNGAKPAEPSQAGQGDYN